MSREGGRRTGAGLLAGYNITISEVDDDSIDLGLAGNRKQGIHTRAPRLDLQLKCLSTDDGKGSKLPYDVKQKNYDDLRDPNVHVPRVLVVCCVPEDIGDWLHETPEVTAMKRCAYWLSLRGMSPTENDTKCRVHIPRTQLFNVEALREIMERIGTGNLP